MTRRRRSKQAPKQDPEAAAPEAEVEGTSATSPGEDQEAATETEGASPEEGPDTGQEEEHPAPEAEDSDTVTETDVPPEEPSPALEEEASPSEADAGISTEQVTVAPETDVAAVSTEVPPSPEGYVIRVEAEGLSRDQIDQILQERAQTLARAPTVEAPGETIQVVTFALGEETYAVEAIHVEEIFPLDEITPVPCTPNFVVGVVNRRGRILSIIDVAEFMGLEGVPLEGGAHVLAVSASGLEVGIVSNQVHSVRTLTVTELGPGLPTSSRVVAEYTRGVTPGMVVFLDLTALLGDEKIVVWQEVG